MIWLGWGIGLFGAIALAAVVYWQMIVAEGAYLGAGVVAWTYDLVAHRYDAIKRYDPVDEKAFLAEPLSQCLVGIRQPLVLDVATGTGRLPQALFRNGFGGQIVGLDLSAGMLRQAQANLSVYGDRTCLVWQDVSQLPFNDGVFDAVTCLEALEFLPHPRQAMAELVRVLAPGGILYISNRVGREAAMLPGRSFSRPAFERLLASHPLRDVQVWPWQEDYDLALARKEGRLDLVGRGGSDLMSLTLCPGCGGRLLAGAGALNCPACRRDFAVTAGIVWLASARKTKDELDVPNDRRYQRS